MISTVVILYYPDSSINDNLSPLVTVANRVFVVDNTEVSQKDSITVELINNPKVKYIHSGNNEGIARPLNTVCQLAISEGYGFLLTMDQDSLFETDKLKKYISYVNKFQNVEAVGMFGIKHIAEQRPKVQNSEFELVTRLITSGSIINLRNFSRIGSFDENLFIDHVDTDYCFKILRAGLKVVLFKNVFLEHRIGTEREYVSLKSFTITSRSLHSPIRIYYMVRNFLYLSSRYQQYFSAELKIIKKDILNRIKNNFLYSAARWKMVRYLAKAITDFRKGRMGKIVM